MLFNQMDFLVSVFNLPMLSVILLSKFTKFERHLNLLFKTDKALNKGTELFWHHSKYGKGKSLITKSYHRAS